MIAWIVLQLIIINVECEHGWIVLIMIGRSNLTDAQYVYRDGCGWTDAFIQMQFNYLKELDNKDCTNRFFEGLWKPFIIYIMRN